uniref:Uncharacterized protein n=1 Tax=Panagrolaimus sp. ES5 TaxID=591445 RepID=A0AC34FXV6_9BILA
MDSEMIQIIEDILDHDISVNAALNRIYYITGDRPSKRILQQRVRRFREQRIKGGQKFGKNSFLKRKMISSEELQAFYDSFSQISSSSSDEDQAENFECKKLSPNLGTKNKKYFKTASEQRISNGSFSLNFGTLSKTAPSAPAVFKDDEIFNHFKLSNCNTFRDGTFQDFNNFKKDDSFDQYSGYLNGLKKSEENEFEWMIQKDSPTSEIDKILKNLHFSNTDSYDLTTSSNLNYLKTDRYNSLSSQMSTPVSPASNADKYKINFGPVFSPLEPVQNENYDKTDSEQNFTNFSKPKCVDHFGQQKLLSNDNLFSPTTTQRVSNSSSSSSASFFKTEFYPTISNSETAAFPNSPSKELFDKIGFLITAQKVDALIDAIDHDWIKQLLDESDESMEDFGDNNDSSKILNPTNMKNLCINIENILNFMKQSITVYSDSKKNNKFFDGKTWETFGEVLNDLLKLKDIYESFEDSENSSTIINRTLFVHDVMKWICGCNGITRDEVKAFFSLFHF